MSAFAIAGPLFAKIDEATAIFVTDFSSKLIVEITPPLVVGLTLSFIMMGVLVIFQTVQMPVAEFLKKSFFYGIILAFALNAGWYQSEIATVITSTPDAFATSLLSDTEAAGGAATVIDVAAEKGFTYASKAFELGSLFSQEGIVFIVYGAMMICATVLLCSIAVCFILLSKVALAILAALGPLFIAALCFRWSHGMFSRWLGQILNYSLLVVMFSALMGFLLSLFSTFMGSANFNTGQNTTLALGAGLITAVSSIMILLQLPHIASALAGGVSLGFWHESRQLGNMAGGMSRLGGSLNRTANRINNAAKAPSGSAAGAGGKGANAAGARAVGNLYKGSMGRR